MSINKTSARDFFDDDFEVIYEGELPDLPPEWGNDDYSDVLSTLSELDDDTDDQEKSFTENGYPDSRLDNDYGNRYEKPGKSSPKRKPPATVKVKRKKKHRTPNLLHAFTKTAKMSAKTAGKIVSLLLRTATLVLITVITGILATNFWDNYSPFGSISTMISEHNYALAAYLATAFILLFIECIAFLFVLFGSKKRSGSSACRIDTGRGLLSFLFIYLGSWFSFHFAYLIPASPEPLQGLKGALTVYGSLNHTLLTLCAAGIVSCLIRRFVLR